MPRAIRLPPDAPTDATPRPGSGRRARRRPALTRPAARRLLAGALAFVVAGASAALPTACAPAARLRAEPGPAPAAPTSDAGVGRPGAVTRHVVIVSIDGLRPDAIARFRPGVIQRLVREGRATLDARTILPSKTLPSHTSMLTGVPPDRHGITWNDDEVVGRGLVPVPTVFAVARQRGLHTAAFFGKAKFRHLMVPGTLDYAQAPTGWWGRWSARRTAHDVRAYLGRTARSGRPPELLFVHLGEPDYVGHAVGWMSWLYGRAVRTADEALAVVVDAADAAYGRGGYTLLLTADHGGQRRDHGTADSLDVTIPWIAWGRGVAAGAALGPGIRTMDTGATALWLLGLDVPEGWEGRPVHRAFTAGAREAASTEAKR
jgi:arylsulfatase A-like enzyme